VTAKTLLHHFPGTFSPVIFESQQEVGGLWDKSPSNPNGANKPSVTLDPRMPTNLSRFTVAFSDLAWESVIDGELPVFPQARQVGRYLGCYTDRYVPKDVLRLGCTVVRTEREVRNGLLKWNVQWLRDRYLKAFLVYHL
jgi:cation diffusion facilitator CzcD-associated flavoprotein CzcO